MRLTKRGKVVGAIALTITALLALYGLAWLSDHINWVGDHYCFHSSIQCYFGKAK